MGTTDKASFKLAFTKQEKRLDDLYLKDRGKINAEKSARTWHRSAVKLLADNRQLVLSKFPTGIIGERFEYSFEGGRTELCYWGDLGRYPVSDRDLFDLLKSELGF